MSKTFINPPELFDSQQYGFSQGVSGKSGRWVVLSGQVAWDANLHLPDDRTLCGQADASFANMARVMRAAGGTLADVVSIRLYIVADQMPHTDCLSELLLRYFPADGLPATTWIGVTCLTQPELLIEMEAFAVIADA